MKTCFSVLLLLFLAVACNSSGKEAPTKKYATELAHRFLITDGHVDVPIRLSEQIRTERPVDDVSRRTKGGHFDYVRAKKGGLDVPFMSIYIPAVYQRLGGAKKFADGLIDLVYDLEKKNPEKFVVVGSPDEAEQAFREGKIGMCMGMENGAPIGDSLENLTYFHRRGIRYITLTHSEDNQICDSSYDSTRTWNGLSPFGREVVKEMNRVGIMIDVSHITDSAFAQVLALSRAPVIASHSSCRYFTPGFERNMGDAQIVALGKNGGVIQINFGSFFLDSVAQVSSDARQQAIKNFLLENEVEVGDSTYEAFMKAYEAGHPPMKSDVERVADHIDRVVQLAGIDHVAFGSDFDGVDWVPKGLEDVSEYPNLILELLKRGYSEEDIEKICHLNLFRVWRVVESVAKEESKITAQ